MATFEASNGGTAFILRLNSCYTPLEQIHNASILCRNGRIGALGGYSALRVIEDIPCLDLSAYHAVPGLVDSHLHGSGGFAVMEADGEGDLAPISGVLATHGVTSFMMTVVASTSEKMLSVTSALADLIEGEYTGARPVGIHFEGPYLNVEKRGAQRERHIRPIDMGEMRELLAAARGHARMVTFAPELTGVEPFLELLLEHGVVPSMGHSLAEEEDVLRAVDAGAKRCTHLYNGMPLLDQRRSGLTAVALTDDRLAIELIADGVHVHPRMIDLACRAKPRSDIIGVSDAIQGAGLSDGVYRLGDEEVVIKDGRCTTAAEGRLAGSSLTLDRAARNLGQFSSLSMPNVIACFTLNAARGLNLPDCGMLQPGMRADITVIDDDWNIKMTIVGGRIVYRSPDIEVNAGQDFP